MSSFTIRLAELQDAPAVASLIRALEIHYSNEECVSDPAATLAMIEQSMTAREGTRYALAFVDDRAVGLACFAILRPGFNLGGLLFLKELFVAKEARGRSVGAALMEWLADYARVHGITRIDLTTDGANVSAQAFYERLGAAKLNKVFYRFAVEPETSGHS